MKRALGKAILLLAALLQPATVTPSFAAAESGFRAGAARIDITPAVADLPKPFKTIHDPLYVRALVLESAGSRAVVVVGDPPTIASDVFASLTRRIADQAGAPAENVMLAVTHTHNAVRLDNNPVGISIPGSAKITAITTDAIIEAVKQATANLRPARAGYATGLFRLAAPRLDGDGNAPRQPPDREIGVLKIEGMDGDPIALIVNNGPEPIMTIGLSAEVSADVAGVMERYVEQRYGEKAVVMYTVGSPPGVIYDTRQHVPGTTLADPYVLMTAVGTILGEEVLATSGRIQAVPELRIVGLLRVLTCPGKVTTPLNLPNRCSDAPGSQLPPCVFTDRDADPVGLRIGLLQIGPLSLIQTDSNVVPPVWAKLRDAAPSPANTILVSLVYGPMHYVVEDASYPGNSYPVTASTAKRGCAEQGLITNALDMIRQAARPQAK